jgi:hypothetical protein
LISDALASSGLRFGNADVAAEIERKMAAEEITRSAAEKRIRDAVRSANFRAAGGKRRPDRWANPGFCRDDRDINQHFLRPAARALGVYSKGFGFHSFRREAITNIARETGAMQAMRAAGHTKMDTTLLYELADQKAQEQAILNSGPSETSSQCRRVHRIQPLSLAIGTSVVSISFSWELKLT